VQPASPEIVYGPELTDLPGDIEALASDPVTGALWFPMLGERQPPYQGLGPRIYRYSPASGKLESWELPGEPYTGSLLDMTLDSQGNIWLAWRYNLVKFDTSTLSATSYPLGKEVQYPTAGATDFSTPVTAVAVDSTGKVWFTRLSDAAILELDPASGSVREHGVPAQFALTLVPRMEIDAQGRLWLPGAVPFGSDSADHLGEFDTASGDFTVHPVPAADVAMGKQGEIWLGGGTSGGLQRFDPQSANASQVADLPIWGPPDFLAVDPNTGDVWLSTFLEAKIGRYSPSSGQVAWYNLPVFEIEGSTGWDVAPVPAGNERIPGTRRSSSAFDVITVDGKGNLWFAEGRTIGMIPAP
jgi:streptogramin lyase